MKNKYLNIIIIFLVVVVVCGTMTNSAMAKDKRVTYLITKESEKDSPKGKWRLIEYRKYKKDGRIVKQREYGSSALYFKYGEKRRLKRSTFGKSYYDKYVYENKGRTIKRGQYYGKRFHIHDIFKFDKRGNVIYWKSYELGSGENPTTIYSYNKNDNLVKVVHYKRGKKYSIETVDYNKRGWITKVKHGAYDKKGKLMYYYTHAKYTYKEDSKFIWQTCNVLSEYDDGYDTSVNKYNKTLKPQPNIPRRPDELPFLLVKCDCDTYKYVFYKNGKSKGLVKYRKEYSFGSYSGTKFYKYKKVNMTLKREKIQNILTNSYARDYSFLEIAPFYIHQEYYDSLIYD